MMLVTQLVFVFVEIILTIASRVKIITINPPVTDPLVPPSSVAAINEFFNNFSKIISYDLSLYVYQRLLEKQNTSIKLIFGDRKQSINNIFSLIQKYKVLNEVENKIYKNTNNTFSRCSLIYKKIFPSKSLEDSINSFSKNILSTLIDEFIFEKKENINSVDMVAISATYDSQIIPSLYISKRIKKLNPNIKILWGGVAITWIADYISDLEICKTIDVIYKGDLPQYNSRIPEILANVLSKNKLQVINQNIFTNSTTKSIYITNGSGYLYLPLNEYWGHKPLISLVLSRGCYYSSCSFCSYGFIKDSRYVSDSATLAVNKLKSYTEKLKINIFNLESDCIKINEIEAIAKKIIKNKLNIRWHISLRFDIRLTFNILQTLYNAGCRRLYFGFESASKNVLKLMKKGIKLDVVERILFDCKKIGIGVEIGVIYGFPGETENDAKETYKFLKTHYDLIYRCDTSFFHLEENSPIERNPAQYKINIIGRDSNYSTFLWKDNNDYEHSKNYLKLTNDLFKKKHVLNISEDILLVNSFGVKSIEENIENDY